MTRSSRSTAGRTCPEIQDRLRLAGGQLHRHPRERPGLPRRGRGGRAPGYNVLVGGGLGTTPSAAKTFTALAKPLGYVDRADVLATGEAVVKVFRDFGNRSDRKRAAQVPGPRLGRARIPGQVEEYLGRPLADPKPVAVHDVDDHLGWHEQGDGKLFLGIPVENGRIADEGPRLFSGLEAFFRRYGTPAG